MVLRITFLLLLFFYFPVNVQAKALVSDLAIRTINIDHDFTGMDILLFGARNDVGTIVTVTRGPKRTYIVRKKERIAGIWVNTQSVTFENAHDYYATASSREFADIKNDYLLSSLEIGKENLYLKTSSPSEDVSVAEFRDAFIRNREKKRLYQKETAEVSFWGDTLFRTTLRFPETISRGLYSAEVYLFNDGRLTAVQAMPLEVRSKGFDAFIYDLAHRHSLLYGVLCVLLALFFGWFASVIFKRA